MLITYGDQIREPGEKPLASLHSFLNRYVSDIVSAVHILPFYPYSSDDGFSVIDYYSIDPALGGWEDVRGLSSDYSLMFDAVINHISAKSTWFEGYLHGDARYRNYFIEGDPNEDYSSVTRPRATPLLHPFETAEGTKHLWTTFSDDQLDLNENKDVLLHILDVLLFYVSQGARFLRLDAIGFLWKKLGTSSIHLQETHTIVQFYREMLELYAPETIIITETNVPHKDNISYFGNGSNEAHLVYQFPLPPLTLHAFHTGQAATLLDWASDLEPTTEQTTFFNFLASHDGIGVVPAKGYLTEADIEGMAEKVKENGGFVSYKRNSDGSESPYELNISYIDALTSPQETDDTRVDRFIAAQSIMLSMMGMPGIYIHSLLGSVSDRKGALKAGQNRTINREKLERSSLEEELTNEEHLRHRVFERYKHMLAIRTAEPCFHPNAAQKVLRLNHSVFSIQRTNEESNESILCLVNISASPQQLTIGAASWQELITDTTYEAESGSLSIELAPYQTMWLKKH
ncbi:alpha-amylase family glycosyl hydrolase [Alteribacillus sp. HJP-4]